MLKTKKNKTAQEEMIGFVLIIVIVLVLLVIFLSLSLKKTSSEEIKGFEAEGFIQACLQYTSDCRDLSDIEHYSIDKLIIKCDNSAHCLDNRPSCEVLNTTLTEILEKSWIIQNNSLVKGYELKIIKEDQELLLIKKGNITNNYQGTIQFLSQDIEVLFKAYY